MKSWVFRDMAQGISVYSNVVPHADPPNATRGLTATGEKTEDEK